MVGDVDSSFKALEDTTKKFNDEADLNEMGTKYVLETFIAAFAITRLRFMANIFGKEFTFTLRENLFIPHS